MYRSVVAPCALSNTLHTPCKMGCCKERRRRRRRVSGPSTGTVTFLFTDVEGSTKMWERHPSIMHKALARHDEILRDTIAWHGGYVFKMVGDAAFAAFPNALDALEAATGCWGCGWPARWVGFGTCGVTSTSDAGGWKRHWQDVAKLRPMPGRGRSWSRVPWLYIRATTSGRWPPPKRRSPSIGGWETEGAPPIPSITLHGWS